MKKLLTFCFLTLFTLPLFAVDYNYVLIPVPDNLILVENNGFELFHRTGDYWIGRLPGDIEPLGGRILCEFNPAEGDLYRIIFADKHQRNNLANNTEILYIKDREAIIRATIGELQSMNAIKGQWIHINPVPKPLRYSGIEVPQTDDFHPMVTEFVSQVSQTQYTNYLQSLQDFVTRNTLTTQCDQAADWILSQFTAMGLNSELDEFTISGNTKYNVVGELTGQLHPDSIVFVTGHYDATAGSPWQVEPQAPGADDNGSGVAGVLECARILSQYNFEKTIRFIAFAGEEQGLYGSEDYVLDLLAANENVVGCFNYDMVAYSGHDPLPPDLMIYVDNNPLSQAMGYKLEEAALTFVPTDIEPVYTVDPSVTYSDHGPFWDAGLPAALGIEAPAWGAEFNPYYHSVNDLISNCDLEYATNCSKVLIAALSDYAGPIPETGPALTIYGLEYEELVGNGNGRPDPDETIGIDVTLKNVGVDPGTGISAVLTTTDPFLTVTQNSSIFPDILPQETGSSLQQYVVDISESCPLGRWVLAELMITADGGYENNAPITFQVSNPIYQPTGPDAYGYYAFDDFDAGGQEFEWIEIDPGMGGAGTLINYTIDDQTIQITLPFNFTYYGIEYSNVSICSNGWIAMGNTGDTDYSNSHIPDPDGPPAMIAPFWEDLSPQLAGTVSHYYDAINHKFIIEFNNVRQYSPSSARETFEIILYDPVHYPTPTGDGTILFQYGPLTDPSSCTVGMEDQSETMGLEILFNGDYSISTSAIDSGRTILFTTVSEAPQVIVELNPYGTPIQIPASGGAFDYNIAGSNNDSTSMTFDIWCDVTLPSGSSYGPLLGPVSITLSPGITIDRDRTQSVPAMAPGGNYVYHAYAGIHPSVVWSSDEFAFEKLAAGDGAIVESWSNWGDDFDGIVSQSSISLPSDYSFSDAYPNPFNPSTKLVFALPEAGYLILTIFDIQGREITVLAEGWYAEGIHEKYFNAKNLASGIYFARLKAGGFLQTKKLLLIK